MTHSHDLYIPLKFNLVASCHLSCQNQNMRGLWSGLCLISLLRGISGSSIDVVPFTIGMYVASIMFSIPAPLTGDSDIGFIPTKPSDRLLQTNHCKDCSLSFHPSLPQAKPPYHLKGTSMMDASLLLSLKWSTYEGRPPHNRLTRQTSIYPQRPTMLRIVGQQVIHTAAIIVCLATVLVNFKKRVDLIGMQGAQRVGIIAHAYRGDLLC
jgi:hypothetical protein